MKLEIQHNIDEWAEALQDAPQEVEDELLKPLAEYVAQRFGLHAVQDHMRRVQAGAPPRQPTDAGPLRSVSGRLARAVQGSFWKGRRESKTEVTIDPKELEWRRVIFVPYAQIHEEGGVVKVPATEDMQNYFWARYYETGAHPDSAFKAMALATRSRTHFRINIPARPYAGPALEDAQEDVVPEARRRIVDWLNEQPS